MPYLSCPIPQCLLVILVFQSAASNQAGRYDTMEKIRGNIQEREPLASDYKWLDYGDVGGPSDRLGMEVDRFGDPGDLGGMPQPCPGGEKFCSKAEDYPEDYIRELLKSGIPEHISDVLSINGGKYRPEDEDSDFVFDSFGDDIVGSNKFDIGPSDKEENLCPTRVMTRYPKKAHDNTGTLQFIVNQEEKGQAVTMEECLNKNNVDIECEIPGTLLATHKSYCKQKYSVRAMVTFDNGKFRVNEFEFPSGCCCVLMKTTN